jgi:hypothetical protein
MQVAILKGKHPCSKQFDAGAAIHRPLERLQSIDMPLGPSIAPRVRHAILYGAFVLPQSVCRCRKNRPRDHRSLTSVMARLDAFCDLAFVPALEARPHAPHRRVNDFIDIETATVMDFGDFIKRAEVACPPEYATVGATFHAIPAALAKGVEFRARS